MCVLIAILIVIFNKYTSLRICDYAKLHCAWYIALVDM